MDDCINIRPHSHNSHSLTFNVQENKKTIYYRRVSIYGYDIKAIH